MSGRAIDRLIEGIAEKENPSVIGLDPRPGMLPTPLLDKHFAARGKTAEAMAEAFAEFGRIIIEAVSDIAPAVKPNIAFYEKYGAPGIAAYTATCEYASRHGLVVIGDVKRGDIGSTAEAYVAHLTPVDIGGEAQEVWTEDFVTLSPYMGADSMEPFARAAAKAKKGLFVLLKTSNAGSADVQDLPLADGRPLYEHVGALIMKLGEAHIGKYGYSDIGAVVGATHPGEGLRLRGLLPHTFFLVPGYGAQGGDAEALRGFFDSDFGGVTVNSSRGITEAWKTLAPGGDYADAVFGAARTAALAMRAELRGLRKK